MRRPSLTNDEPFRLDALRRMRLLETPLEERFERITRLATRLFGTPIAAVSLVDADRQWFKSIQGLSAVETSRDVSFCGHTIVADEVLVVPDARADIRFAENPLVTGDPFIVFYAGHPVRTADGSCIGTLCLIDRETRQMSDDDLQALRDLAAMVEAEIATAVPSSAQAEVIAQAGVSSRRALIDPLTRLWNRKGILEVLEHQLGQSRDGCAIMLVDVDLFTRINDQWGQVVGDEVLQHLSRRMLGAIRETDAIGRYISDGFMVICGGYYDPPAMKAVAERLRAAVQERPFETAETDAQSIDLTVSVGMACFPTHAIEGADEILRAADAALEAAKRGGRNRVEVFGGVVGDVKAA